MHALGESQPGASALNNTVVSSWAAVAEAAKRRLRRDTYLFNKQITCEFHEGVLILRGSVPTYYLKQVAQALVAEVEGVQDVVNKIDVSPETLPRKSR